MSMTMTTAKQQKLDDIAASIVADKVCPDLAATATHMVFGDGNANADVVFVGEAPGKNEDIQGLPFVGASGKFLDEMLEGIGLHRSDVYITSILKYRPSNNRDPKPAEKAAFWPYLQTQLATIDPKLIVTLGRHSLNCFLPDLHIAQVHGHPQHIRMQVGAKAYAWDIMPLYHPAAALYNSKMRQTLIDDFGKIPAIITKDI